MDTIGNKHFESERNISRWLRTKAPLDAHTQAIENTIDRGTPDLNICWAGIELWIELKRSLTANRVIIRKEQYAWGRARAQAKGNALLLTYHVPTENFSLRSFHNMPNFRVCPHRKTTVGVHLNVTENSHMGFHRDDFHFGLLTEALSLE